jgi:molecular chaperone GrpE
VSEEPVIHDRRRIDPDTGEVRPNADTPAVDSSDEVDIDVEGVDAVADDIAVLTADLQRLQAEYANYRKRVDRDRDSIRDLAMGAVLSELLPVLDDFDRARSHGELEGGFKAIAEQIDRILTRIGLERFGAPGEEFDPVIHEALTHTTSADVSTTTAVDVLQPGYKFRERILRPARVAVADPE